MRAVFSNRPLSAGAALCACGAALPLILSPARAADLDYSALRGAIVEEKASVETDWSGTYAGVQAGYGNADVDFGNATGDLLAHVLRNTIIEAEAGVSSWTTLPERNVRRGVFGAFIGYNSQWDDVVVGAEINYNRSNIAVTSRDQLQGSFVTSNQYTYNVSVEGRSTVKITDYMTLRTRAGYALGSFMPYATLGLALGRASVDRSASVAATAVDFSGAARPTLALDPNPSVITEKKNNEFTYGLAAGFGVDVLLTESVFLRGEYEYIRFVSFSKARADINALRGAVGVKF